MKLITDRSEKNSNQRNTKDSIPKFKTNPFTQQSTPIKPFNFKSDKELKIANF